MPAYGEAQFEPMLGANADEIGSVSGSFRYRHRCSCWRFREHLAGRVFGLESDTLVHGTWQNVNGHHVGRSTAEPNHMGTKDMCHEDTQPSAHPSSVQLDEYDFGSVEMTILGIFWHPQPLGFLLLQIRISPFTASFNCRHDKGLRMT